MAGRKKRKSQKDSLIFDGDVKEPAIKASTWLWMVLVGALGGGITDVAQPLVADAFQSVVEWGNPVETFSVEEPAHRAVWLPGQDQLSDQRLTELSRMEPEAQIAAMDIQGGIVIGERKVKMILTGNREQEVSIIDMRPISSCSGYESGSLVLTGLPALGSEATSQMVMEVDQPSQEPILYDPEDNSGASVRFFDAKSIKLAKNEQHSVILRLKSDLVCSVNIEITTVEGQKVDTQMLFDEGDEIIVAGGAWSMDKSLIRRTYVGGDICNPYEMIPTVPDDIIEFVVNEGCPNKDLG